LASQDSNSKSALSPARQRINSTRHRARPTPGTGKGVDGSTLTRQRVTEAVGWLPPMLRGRLGSAAADPRGEDAGEEPLLAA